MRTSLHVALLALWMLALPATSADRTDGEWYGKSPVGAGILSDLIQQGDVSPGNEFTVEVGGRFQRVHAKLMAINCISCHAGVKFPEDLQFLRRDEYPIAAYPGAVDRGICLGCHRGQGALATPFYIWRGQ
jgi:hypothetical protein